MVNITTGCLDCDSASQDGTHKVDSRYILAVESTWIGSKLAIGEGAWEKDRK